MQVDRGVPVASVTIGFSVPEEDLERLDRLTERFAQGNRSAFLRIALSHMEVLDRAQRLRELQAFGVQHRDEVGLADTDVETIVERVLAKRLPRG
jgi:Arc/MetJ-type ribon-helix-helix transcriptional regulator